MRLQRFLIKHVSKQKIDDTQPSTTEKNTEKQFEQHICDQHQSKLDSKSYLFVVIDKVAVW
jgi:hypothetical protein